MRAKFKVIPFLLILMLAISLPLAAVADGGGGSIIIDVPHGATITMPYPPGTIRIDLGANGGPIFINDVLLINAPANSTIIRHPNGSSTVTVGGFTIIAPAGSVISTPNPSGTLRVDFGTGGTVNVNGTNLATASAGVSVVFNTNNTTTAIVAGSTTITMPTTNGPNIVDNGNGTATVTLPGQAPITIPANGGNWYAVFFNSNGGGSVAAQIIESGTVVATPTSPTRAGFTLGGWYSNPALTNAWDFGTSTVSSITTLHARWEAVIAPPPTSESAPPAEEVLEEVLVEETSVEEALPEEEPLEIEPDEELPEEEEEEEEDEEADAEEEVPEDEPEEAQEADENDSTDTEVNESNESVADEYITQDEQIIIESSWSNFGNSVPLNESVSPYRIISRPSLGVQFLHGQLPAFTSGDGLLYAISYRTNLDSSQRVIAGHIPANRPFEFSPPDLQDDEIITEISIEFDTVPFGFGVGDTITYSFVVLDEDNATIYWEVMFGETSSRNFIIAAILDNINRVSELQNRYTVESWANLQAVISTVQVTLDNPNVTIEEIEEAYVVLQQAIDELTPAPAPSPFTLGNILGAVGIVALLVGATFAVFKLLRHKKRMALKKQPV